MLEHRFLLSGLAVLSGIAWVIFILWPEILRLRIIENPAEAEDSRSPAWLYVYAFAALIAVGVWGGSIYYSAKSRPSILTADEFSQQFITGKRFRLSDFTTYSGGNVIEDRVFEDCWIYGPAVVVVQGGYFQDISVAVDSIDHVLLEFPPNSAVVGVVALRNCVFRRCHFSNVAFLGSAEDLKRFREQAQRGSHVPK